MSFEVSINDQTVYHIITLTDMAVGTKAEIYAFGGMLNAFRVSVQGKPINLVDGYNFVADAEKNMLNSFKSAKLSPFVCRMREGSYRLGGKTYRIQKHYLGKHAMHGLIYDGLFTIIHSESSDTGAGVTLKYEYKGDDQGYPFPYMVIVNWKLETGNRLTVATTVSHHNPQVIPFADGWHPYFTLGGSVDSWKMQFNSHTQLAYDEELLPTGRKITDTRFEKGISLQSIFLDNGFEFDGGDTQAFCILSNDLLKLTIEPDKTYPILQVYTPPHRKSIAIENLSGAPDNFNNAMHLLWLKPEQPQTFITRYTIEIL